MKDCVYQSFAASIDSAAENLGLTRTQYEFSKYPEREMIVSIPVEMDDGTVTIFHGFRVQHSSLFGPYMGGLRLHPTVEYQQIRGLAGLMTLKCALASLPFGGACGGVVADKGLLSANELKRLVRRYTAMVLPVIGPNEDIHTHDAGTDSEIIGWMMDTYSMMAGHMVPGIVTGKPVELSGSLGSASATGVGAGYILTDAMKRHKISRERCSAAVVGFGKVGQAAAKTMYDDGIKIVAVSDSTGGIVCPGGIDIQNLIAHKKGGGSIALYNSPGIQHVEREEVLTCSCTVLATCGVDTVLDEQGAAALDCQIVLEAGDAQITREADGILAQRDILVLPDLVATLGGLVVSYFERVQNVQSLMWDEYEVNRMLKSIVLRTFDEVWEQAAKHSLTLRDASYYLGLQRVCEAKRIRGIFP